MCLNGFRLDQPMHIELWMGESGGNVAITNMVFTIETDGEESSANILNSAAALTPASLF